MAALTVEIPDSVVAALETVARERHCSVSEVAAEKLRSGASREDALAQRDRILAQLVAEGRLTPPPSKGAVSQEQRDKDTRRRMELARKLGKAGPLSEVIIAERR
jgi:predicted transcriptional regulator